jgi:hypothetical protein
MYLSANSRLAEIVPGGLCASCERFPGLVQGAGLGRSAPVGGGLFLAMPLSPSNEASALARRTAAAPLGEQPDGYREQ